MHAKEGEKTRPIKNQNIVWRKEGNKVLTFDPDTGEICMFNPTASKIWELCNGSNTIKDICNTIRRDFEDARPQEVRKDVEEFIKEAKEANLISLIDRNTH